MRIIWAAEQRERRTSALADKAKQPWTSSKSHSWVSKRLKLRVIEDTFALLWVWVLWNERWRVWEEWDNIWKWYHDIILISIYPHCLAQCQLKTESMITLNNSIHPNHPNREHDPLIVKSGWQRQEKSDGSWHSKSDGTSALSRRTWRLCRSGSSSTSRFTWRTRTPRPRWTEGPPMRQKMAESQADLEGMARKASKHMRSRVESLNLQCDVRDSTSFWYTLGGNQ